MSLGDAIEPVMVIPNRKFSSPPLSDVANEPRSCALDGKSLNPWEAIWSGSLSYDTSTLRSLLKGSNKSDRQFPGAADVALPLPFVSSRDFPEKSNPAPIESSLRLVNTTGKPGEPKTCKEPPMRSLMSNGRPVAVKPAVLPNNLITRLSSDLLVNRRPPYVW